MPRPAKAFTFIEVLFVIIIAGVLATLGVMYQSVTVEKGRAAEAKSALAEIRTIWSNYGLEHKDNLDNLQALYEYMEKNEEVLPAVIPLSCTNNSYFRYSISGTTAVAQRCTAAGKKPNGRLAYNVTLGLVDGSWNGTPGYY